MRSARVAVQLVALLVACCSYDYSGVRIVDRPPVDGGVGGADAGPRFSCDPIAQTCGPMLHCAMVSDSAAQISARCVVPGTGSASAGCDGPEDCAPGYYCRSTTTGSMTCQSFCTDVAPTCADARTCDTPIVLFEIGAHRGHPCR